MTFCDIGANVGFYTNLGRVCRRTERGRVVAFEAFPGNAAQAQLSIMRNGYAEFVEVFPLALSDRRRVYRYIRAQGANGYVAECDPTDVNSSDSTLLVQAVRLDDLAAVIGGMDVVKIDVEGAEGAVMRGAFATLEKYRPIVFSELCLGQLARTSSMTGEEYLSIYAKLGYSFKVVTFAGVMESIGDDPAAVVEYAQKADTAHVDIKCVPPRAG